MDNQYTLEYMAERLTDNNTKYRSDIQITFSDGEWMIRWGHSDITDPDAEEDDSWGATFRADTLREVLEEAYWGMIN